MKGTIEFDGMITGKAKKFYDRKEALSWVCLTACIWIGSCIIMLIAFPLMFGRSTDFDLRGCLICMVICLIIFCTLALLAVFFKKYNLKKISFDSRNLYIFKGKRNFTVPVSGIKQIEDYGEFYQIKLYVASYVGSDLNIFICQKDLLAKGTLEEFEKMFKNKIVRSEKND